VTIWSRVNTLHDLARYDEHVDWYDEFAAGGSFVELREHAVELLGPPSGRCLDLGCGTGLALPLLEAAGWDAIGVEVSEGQLARARERSANVLLADAHALPFENCAFDAVVSILTHTDFDDAGAIGRRYRRQDEIGTPYCITVDFDSLEDQAVTIRERDAMTQDRIAIDAVSDYLAVRLKGC